MKFELDVGWASNEVLKKPSARRHVVHYLDGTQDTFYNANALGFFVVLVRNGGEA